MLRSKLFVSSFAARDISEVGDSGGEFCVLRESSMNDVQQSRRFSFLGESFAGVGCMVVRHGMRHCL